MAISALLPKIVTTLCEFLHVMDGRSIIVLNEVVEMQFPDDYE